MNLRRNLRILILEHLGSTGGVSEFFGAHGAPKTVSADFRIHRGHRTNPVILALSLSLSLFGNRRLCADLESSKSEVSALTARNEELEERSQVCPGCKTLACVCLEAILLCVRTSSHIRICFCPVLVAPASFSLGGQNAFWRAPSRVYLPPPGLFSSRFISLSSLRCGPVCLFSACCLRLVSLYISHQARACVFCEECAQTQLVSSEWHTFVYSMGLSFLLPLPVAKTHTRRSRATRTHWRLAVRD